MGIEGVRRSHVKNIVRRMQNGKVEQLAEEDEEEDA